MYDTPLICTWMPYVHCRYNYSIICSFSILPFDSLCQEPWYIRCFDDWHFHNTHTCLSFSSLFHYLQTIIFHHASYQDIRGGLQCVSGFHDLSVEFLSMYRRKCSTKSSSFHSSQLFSFCTIASRMGPSLSKIA